MEWLKDLLDLDDEQVEKVKEEFPKHAVPKEQYNKKAEKIDELQAELDETTNQLEQTSEQVNDLNKYAEENQELQEKVKKIQEEKEKFEQEKDQRIAEIQKKTQLEKELLASNVPEDAVDLLVSDFNLDEMELDDDGKLKNVDEHKEKVKKKRPSLFAEEKISGNKPADGGSEDKVFTMESIDKMTEEEINANWDKVQEVLQNN